jgi:hypothetical protein
MAGFDRVGRLASDDFLGVSHWHEGP